jgi:hypothetical protein
MNFLILDFTTVDKSFPSPCRFFSSWLPRSPDGEIGGQDGAQPFNQGMVNVPYKVHLNDYVPRILHM